VPLHIRVESGLVRRKASKVFQQRVNILIELVRVGREIEPVDGEEDLVGVIPLLVGSEFFHVAPGTLAMLAHPEPTPEETAG
jgi:hypothetical protein